MILGVANRACVLRTCKTSLFRATQPHASTSLLTARPIPTSPYSSHGSPESDSQHLGQSTDDFFAGFSSESTSPSLLPPPPSPPPTTAAHPVATDRSPWQRSSDRIAEDVQVRRALDPEDEDIPSPPRPPAPFVSAIRIVQSLLDEREFLNTQQIWRIATEGLKPVLQPAQLINPDGRIKMKKVSTMREQKRVWMPPPSAPLPDHPFQSVSLDPLPTFIRLALMGSNQVFEKHGASIA